MAKILATLDKFELARIKCKLIISALTLTSTKTMELGLEVNNERGPCSVYIFTSRSNWCINEKK